MSRFLNRDLRFFLQRLEIVNRKTIPFRNKWQKESEIAIPGIGIDPTVQLNHRQRLRDCRTSSDGSLPVSLERQLASKNVF